MNQMPVLLSVLIVSYNTRDVTLECIRSAYRETRETDFEIIVVDNASTDGSAEAIAAEFPDIRLIAHEDNLGFGRATNLAAEHARGDLILLLNPDTVVLNGAIDTLVRFAHDHPECGIWGGRTLFPDRSLNPTSCWRGMTLWGLFTRAVGLSALLPRSPLFNSESYGGWDRDDVREVDTVTGCFLLIYRQLWQDLGGFDPTFYMYGEEADLCLRARKRGARPTINPEAQIIHYGGLSETVPADKIERLMCAKITLARKHWGRVWIWMATQMFRLFVSLRALGYGIAASLTGKPKHRKKATTWRQVWKHRQNWLRGYP